KYTLAFIATFVIALVAAIAAVQLWSLPLWTVSAGVLGALILPAIPKWMSDRRRYGLTAMVLCVLVAAQGFHTVEHVAQWAQYHLLRWPFWKASGLISPANAEWVHFVWNWLVLAAVIFLMRGGMRNIWAWLLLAWATAHTLEHTYMMIRYLNALQELRQLGVSDVAAQGLPGILGRDGWLASSPVTQNTFVCRLPGVTTATRLDVHFWWNVGEVVLLIPAANQYMSGLVESDSHPPSPA
ncbi:MAG TPA: hypothetical protein VFT99_20940, partial [Roseiflexaceae bacterium]|nr:hypothetical protein [Roseiflexaceae bacterium]